MNINRDNLIEISQVDRKYIGIPSLVVTMLLNIEVVPQDLYNSIKVAMKEMPLFSSKVIEMEDGLFLMYEEDCFKFNYFKEKGVEIKEAFSSESFTLKDLGCSIDDEITEMNKPLTSLTLTGIEGGKSVITISYSHVLGDAQTGKMFIYLLSKIMKGEKLSKIESSRAYPFENTEKWQDKELDMNKSYENHKYSGLVHSREVQIDMMNYKVDYLKGILDRYNEHNKEEKCNYIDVVSAIIIKEHSLKFFPKSEKFKIKVPINVRFIDKEKGNSYAGNAYYSVVFEYTREEIENSQFEDIIKDINQKIKSHKDKEFLKSEMNKNGKKEKDNSTEIIISNIGNISFTKKFFGDGILENILTISSDPNVFVIQKDSRGYGLQIFIQKV